MITIGGIKFFFDTAHWGRTTKYKVHHGPQEWPWWRVFTLSYVLLALQPDSTMYGGRVWLYSRWGAINWDYYVPKSSCVYK